MILYVEEINDNADEAHACLGRPLSSDHSELICTWVRPETSHPTAQARPPKQPDPKQPTRQIQPPAPPPAPGKTTWRVHYEAAPTTPSTAAHS